jgi:XRE family transcriptional regulator, regulator of sulfur utilization
MKTPRSKTITKPTPTLSQIAANSNSEPPFVGSILLAMRQAHGLSLDDLSKRAGVSKSMLSQIERNQANPTVALVWRLSNALGVSISDLLSTNPDRQPALVVTEAHAVPSLNSPDGKCELKILGPLDRAGQFEWYLLSIVPEGVLDSHAHEHGSREHLTVLSGSLDVKVGTKFYRLKKGETARYACDTPHTISNSSKNLATAIMVVTFNT